MIQRKEARPAPVNMISDCESFSTDLLNNVYFRLNLKTTDQLEVEAASVVKILQEAM